MTAKTKTPTAKQKFIGALAHAHEGHTVNVSPATSILYMSALGKDICVASVNTYKERTSLDIRRFYLNDTTQQYEPTAKGIRVPLDVAPAMAEALHSAALNGAFEQEGTK